MFEIQILNSIFKENDKSRNSEWNRKDNRHRQGCGCYHNRTVHDCCQGQSCARRKRVSPWLRIFHRQDPCRKDRPQHQQEHYHHHPSTQYPGVQTCKHLQRGSRKVNGRD